MALSHYESTINVVLVIISRLAVVNIMRKQVLVETCRLTHLSVALSVGLSVQRVYCGKMADWIWTFGVVSGVGRGMGA